MLIAIDKNLTSADPNLVLRSADLNDAPFVATIIADSTGRLHGSTPTARFVGKGDIEKPPAPAWYMPDEDNIYIHVDEADIHLTGTKIAAGSDIRGHAIACGLLAHEAGHAAISDDMEAVIRSAPQHTETLTLLEELRVENHALRRAPSIRRDLRASLSLILANLPDEFETKAHVVRAWVIARGRALNGVAEPTETHSVDIAARTILDDEIVDALTDLTQEALTLNLSRTSGRARMIEIAEEWRELVGDSAPSTSCTRCVRSKATGDGEGADGEKGDEPGDGDETGDGGDGKGDDHDGHAHGGDKSGDEAAGEAVMSDDFTWGTPGADDPTKDGPKHDLLADEAAELMKALTRDLADKLVKDWATLPTGSKVANAAEWAAKVFGNRKDSTRLRRSEPTGEMRQHVVRVSQELSNLSLPAISKTKRAAALPPGRMRSREALRATAERAQGAMITATPWRTTKRRHSTARPLVLGIATDTSGSMRWAESGVAEFAYVYANAGHRIGARTAAVTFGDMVHRIARPGEVMNQVVTKDAADGTEEFDKAIAALDGVLYLTTQTAAAKILFIVSDGALVKSGETGRAMEWLTEMDRVGTHVIWISDHADKGGAFWLSKAARKLKHLTIRGAWDGGGKSSMWSDDANVFDLLNTQAIDAIRKTTSAA